MSDIQYIEMLGNCNTNLDTLDIQIRKAKILGEPIMVEYFEELRSIVLGRYKSNMIKLANQPDKFVKERGQFFYTDNY